MSGKVIDARDGDRWARFRDRSGMVMRDVDGNVLLVGRDMLEPVRIFESNIVGELEDLATPEAHAQLREWGYEMRGDVADTSTVMPNGTVIETRYSFPGWYKFDHDLTDHQIAQVREIVEEVLAAKAKPAPGEVAVHATPFPQRSKPAPTFDDWRARCRVWMPIPNETVEHPFAVHSPTGKWHIYYSDQAGFIRWERNSELFVGRNFRTESHAISILAKATLPPDVIEVGDGVPYGGKTYRIVESSKSPPPPDVSPEPDWRGLLDAVVNARSHTEHDMALEKAAKALSSARTNLAAKGGK